MPKRILQGTVVSDKNEKTVVVRVERRFAHPVMRKIVRRTKNYKAHDENNQYKVRFEARALAPRRESCKKQAIGTERPGNGRSSAFSARKVPLGKPPWQYPSRAKKN